MCWFIISFWFNRTTYDFFFIFVNIFGENQLRFVLYLSRVSKSTLKLIWSFLFLHTILIMSMELYSICNVFKIKFRVISIKWTAKVSWLIFIPIMIKSPIQTTFDSKPIVVICNCLTKLLHNFPQIFGIIRFILFFF